jgi:hypothetical protein
MTKKIIFKAEKKIKIYVSKTKKDPFEIFFDNYYNIKLHK